MGKGMDAIRCHDATVAHALSLVQRAPGAGAEFRRAVAWREHVIATYEQRIERLIAPFTWPDPPWYGRNPHLYCEWVGDSVICRECGRMRPLGI